MIDFNELFEKMQKGMKHYFTYFDEFKEKELKIMKKF